MAMITAFEAYLSTLKVEFNITALTDTWLNETNADVYGLAGYKGTHKMLIWQVAEHSNQKIFAYLKVWVGSDIEP